MREFFVAFRSRSDAMRFYEEVASYHFAARIINTPQSAGVGCGLSVKMLAGDMQKAKAVLSRGGYPSAIGLFGIGARGEAVRLV